MSVNRAAFSDRVKDALAHFYDLSVLQTHPLAEVLAASTASQSTRGQALRSVLADTIESLRPKDIVPFDRPEWLTYRAMALRYIECLTPDEACHELGLGRTSFYKYLNVGLEGVIDILWERVGVQEPRGTEPSRPEGGPAPAEREAMRVAQTSARQPVNLWTVMEGALVTLAPLSDKRQIALSADPPPHCSLVYGDPAMLRQALLGILMEVITRVDAGVCRLDLVDQGDQVAWRLWSQDKRTHLCDQLAAASGIALARNVLAVYGGHLAISAGCPDQPIISFTLPTLRPRTVLIVDDDPNAQRLYRHYLQAEEYDVRVATDAHSAWATLQAERPDAIILDVLMPQEDGWNVLQRLRTQPETRGIPVLICSVLSQPQLALALGADQVLQKPVDQEQMLRTLRRLTLPGTEDGVHPEVRADNARL